MFNIHQIRRTRDRSPCHSTCQHVDKLSVSISFQSNIAPYRSTTGSVPATDTGAIDTSVVAPKLSLSLWTSLSLLLALTDMPPGGVLPRMKLGVPGRPCAGVPGAEDGVTSPALSVPRPPIDVPSTALTSSSTSARRVEEGPAYVTTFIVNCMQSYGVVDIHTSAACRRSVSAFWRSARALRSSLSFARFASISARRLSDMLGCANCIV